MKKMTLGLLLTFCFNLYAESELKITSFYLINRDSTKDRAAEICGTIKGLSSWPTFIQIITDEKTNNPAHYSAWAGPSGNFCAVVTTYAGTVQVTLPQTSTSVSESLN